MLFAIVKNEDLSIQHTYESSINRDSDKFFSYLSCSPVCSHVEIPEYLDRELIKAKLNDDGEIEIVPDEEKITFKNNELIKAKIFEITQVMNDDIDEEMFNTYGTRDRITASAIHQSWGDMLICPEAYVPTVFPSVNILQVYVTKQLTKSRNFNLWRLSRVARRDAEIAAL